jgi:hypothetical protein
MPGNSTTLQFTVPLADIASTQQRIPFRDCIPGEIHTVVGTNLVTCNNCTRGTYSFHPSDTECHICPAHASCPGLNVIDVHAGYWRVDQTSASVLECPQQQLCLGGTDTDDQCAEGSGGPYCSVCDDGYTPSRSGLCYPCDNAGDVASELVSTVLFVVVLLLGALAYKYRKRLAKLYTRSLNKVLKNRKLRTLRVKFKIIVSFCQIVYQLGPALNVVFPSIFVQYLNYYAIFQLNLLLLPNVSCMVPTSYYSGLLVSTISPFVFFAVIALLIQFLVLRARRLNERNPWYRREQATKDTITAAFLISYFVLVNVSTQIFRVFQCETFDDGRSYLVADYSIDCDAPDRSFYLAYGSVMILVYPIGIPLVYAMVLVAYRHQINPDWRKVVDSNEKAFVSNRVIQQEKIKVRNTYPEIDNIRNLFDSFTPKRWYFELFDCARRLCLGAVPVLIFRGSTLQIVIVLLISLASVAAFMYFNPYIHEHDNNLAVLSQWSITLILIAALIIKIEALSSDPNNAQGLGLVLIFLNVLIVVFALATAVANAKETDDLDPKGLFGLEGDDGAETGDEEADGKKRRKKSARQAEQQKKSSVFFAVNPLFGTARRTGASSGQQEQEATAAEGGREADSDLGSQGSDDEDGHSLDSDDDNFEELRRRRRQKSGAGEDEADEPDPEAEAPPRANRGILARVFSARQQQRQAGGSSSVDGQRAPSSASENGLELNTFRQQNPLHRPPEADQPAEEVEAPPHPAAVRTPSRQFSRDLTSTNIDSDDDE